MSKFILQLNKCYYGLQFMQTMSGRLQRHIQNSVKQLRWNVYKNSLQLWAADYFCKDSILYVWQGSEYASGLLALLWFWE